MNKGMSEQVIRESIGRLRHGLGLQARGLVHRDWNV